MGNACARALGRPNLAVIDVNKRGHFVVAGRALSFPAELLFCFLEKMPVEFLLAGHENVCRESLC